MKIYTYFILVIFLTLAGCNKSISSSYNKTALNTYQLEVMSNDISANVSLISNTFDEYGMNLTQYGPTIDYPELRSQRSRYFHLSEENSQVVVSLLQDEVILHIKILSAKKVRDQNDIQIRQQDLLKAVNDLKNSSYFK